MTDQLFTLDTTPPDAPRCRMCERPAWRSLSTGEFTTYCGSKGCSNRTRTCQECRGSFVVGVDGAGTKYCSAACKKRGYRPTRVDTVCAWCGTPKPSAGRPGGEHWPYICQQCLHPIRHVVSRLKAHRVPHQLARRLLTDPVCEVCGVDLLGRVKDTSTGTGRYQARLVIDHDHACCPASKSCGRCVRGFLCGHCNTAAGMLHDNPTHAGNLAAYLRRCQERATLTAWQAGPHAADTAPNTNGYGHSGHHR